MMLARKLLRLLQTHCSQQQGYAVGHWPRFLLIDARRRFSKSTT
jgi:hypothetical protein